MPSVIRKRGFVLTAAGLQKLQDAGVTQDEFGYRQTLAALGKSTQLDPRTIARIISCTKGVDLHSLEQFFRSFYIKLETSDYTNFNDEGRLTQHRRTAQSDLQDAVDVSVFHGRQDELHTLQKWIGPLRCRLVAILGMGGIGKTALSVKLAHSVESEFEFVIWRSLHNASLLYNLLNSLVQFLSRQQEAQLPDDIDEAISRLMQYLRQHRCLLVLDNVESILQGGLRAGYYREGYEDYSRLFQQVVQTVHQSCLVLTSREKLKEIKVLEGDSFPVRSLQLEGLTVPQGRDLLESKSSFSGSEPDWNVLVKHYAGNPLALKIVAPAIQEFFSGNVSEFVRYLHQDIFLFDDIRDLLGRQFNRLSIYIFDHLSYLKNPHLVRRYRKLLLFISSFLGEQTQLT